MMTRLCECEHAAHFERDKRTPNGNPGHKWGAKFATRVPVKTPYGTFHVCVDCASDCLAKQRVNPARRRTRKKARRSERGFFPKMSEGLRQAFVRRDVRARVKAKRRRNPAIRLDWHTFAGGTAAAEGKNSYQAITGGLNGREQYLIDPISWPNGRHRYYKLQYFGAGGYKTLATNARVATLKKAAAEHLLDVVLTATNPRRRNPTTRIRSGIHFKTIKASKALRRSLATQQLQGERHHRRGVVTKPGRSAYGEPYKVQVRRDKKWITLGSFPFHAQAQDYGRALKTRYPSKIFRVFW